LIDAEAYPVIKQTGAVIDIVIGTVRALGAGVGYINGQHVTKLDAFGIFGKNVWRFIAQPAAKAGRNLRTYLPQTRDARQEKETVFIVMIAAQARFEDEFIADIPCVLYKSANGFIVIAAQGKAAGFVLAEVVAQVINAGNPICFGAFVGIVGFAVSGKLYAGKCIIGQVDGTVKIADAVFKL
jgi:hypothetical protein